MKFLVALAFLAILASLGSALFFMMRGGKDEGDDKARGDRMARALALRIGLSVLLFICILIAWKLGYIQPGGIPLAK
jgi:formate hydrogenlyase subunit 3/multisubunit Na+/H+ antiporter MnhD subunit